jgi:hypothetical protein
MEKRIIEKVNSQNGIYKSQLLHIMKEFKTENITYLELLEWIHNHNPIELTKTDFIKRKRSKNSVPVEYRCEARCAKGSGHEGEQCTRRKKNGCVYCGTHMKGIPNGIMEHQLPEIKKKTIWVEEYRGIMYYIDEENVYNTEDIKQNKVNPEIIGTCKKNGNSYEIKLNI